MSEQVFSGPSEQSLRRVDFVGGVTIKLIDGQEWYFAEPRCRLVPSDGDSGFQVILSLDDDGTFDALLTEYQELMWLGKDEFAEQRLHFAGLELRLGRLMLERNYNLTIKHIRSILQISHNHDTDPIASEIRSAITRIISGDAPKLSAGGDEPSLTPSAQSDSTTECS